MIFALIEKIPIDASKRDLGKIASFIVHVARNVELSREYIKNLRFKISRSIETRERIHRHGHEAREEVLLSTTQDVRKCFIWHEKFTNVFLILYLIKMCFPWQQLSRFFGLLDRPVNCLIAGRLILHPVASKPIEITLFTADLLWRLTQRTKKPNMQNSILFLMQDAAQIRRFEQLVQADRLEGLSVDGIIFRDMLCYPVLTPHGVKYRLRPNRTLSAYNFLAKSMVILVKNAEFVLFSSGPLLILINLYVMTSDIGYLSGYSGCAFELDKMQQIDMTSFTFHWHKVYIFGFDLIENFVFWSDTYMNVLYLLVAALWVSVDLHLYWEGTSARLDRIYEQVKLARFFSVDPFGRSRRSQIVRKTSIDYPMLNDADRSWAARVKRDSKKMKIDPEAEILCAEMRDFFEQFEHADTIVGDVLTIGLFVWILTFSIFSYATMVQSKRSSSSTVGLHMVQLCAGILYTLANSALWMIHKTLMRSHSTLCSLIAYEDNVNHKLRYLSVLDFFTERKRTSFTLLRSYPVVSRTYLTLIGWTVTCLAVVGNGLFS